MSHNHEVRVLTDTHSTVVHIENQATTPSSRHEDVDRTVDHAEEQGDMERTCHRANKVHKGQYLDLQKLWVLSTETEAAGTLAVSERNIDVLCCSFAVAFDSAPSPLPEMN